MRLAAGVALLAAVAGALALGQARAQAPMVGVAQAPPEPPAPATPQARMVHGEKDVFVTEGLVVAWAVLRGASEEATQIVLRLVVRDGRYAYVAVDGVDPFSGSRRPVLAGAPLGESLDVRSPRASFADFPRRELRFYRTADDWRRGRPALTVYYLGVPDTTPELASEAALSAYLADAVRRARRGR